MSSYLKEFLRCTKHNLLHLRNFRLSYTGGRWLVRDGEIEMQFPYYPYLAFHDIEGYLLGGRMRPRPGMTVVDAGGCFGEYSLFASKCVGPTGRVLMLEPDPANVVRAREVLAMNGSPANIEIVPAGLWSSAGSLRFSAGHDATSAIVQPSDSSSNTIEIQTHSLQSLMGCYSLSKIDLVKMDIEGAEVEVISSSAGLPQQCKPDYAIASYHIVGGVRAAGTLEKLFAARGYNAKTGYPQHITTWASAAAL